MLYGDCVAQAARVPVPLFSFFQKSASILGTNLDAHYGVNAWKRNITSSNRQLLRVHIGRIPEGSTCPSPPFH